MPPPSLPFKDSHIDVLLGSLSVFFFYAELVILGSEPNRWRGFSRVSFWVTSITREKRFGATVNSGARAGVHRPRSPTCQPHALGTDGASVPRTRSPFASEPSLDDARDHCSSSDGPVFSVKAHWSSNPFTSPSFSFSSYSGRDLVFPPHDWPPLSKMSLQLFTIRDVDFNCYGIFSFLQALPARFPLLHGCPPICLALPVIACPASRGPGNPQWWGTLMLSGQGRDISWNKTVSDHTRLTPLHF